jgi:hypothetical protein
VDAVLVPVNVVLLGGVFRCRKWSEIMAVAETKLLETHSQDQPSCRHEARNTLNLDYFSLELTSKSKRPISLKYIIRYISTDSTQLTDDYLWRLMPVQKLLLISANKVEAKLCSTRRNTKAMTP